MQRNCWQVFLSQLFASRLLVELVCASISDNNIFINAGTFGQKVTFPLADLVHLIVSTEEFVPLITRILLLQTDKLWSLCVKCWPLNMSWSFGSQSIGALRLVFHADVAVHFRPKINFVAAIEVSSPLDSVNYCGIRSVSLWLKSRRSTPTSELTSDGRHRVVSIESLFVGLGCKLKNRTH
jgi:hypothetical protein